VTAGREKPDNENGGAGVASSMVGRVLRDIRGETLQLSLEARAYFASRPIPDADKATSLDKLIMSREMLFIAARLSQVMLWVLTREGKGPPAGQGGGPASAADCEDEAAWQADPLLMSESDGGDCEPSFAPRFQELRESSLSLYRRVARLDEQVGVA
jgi:hypothetical protein